ncbi:hypothetical protein ISF_04978 [Cordyceps fumosorosea ARSEF 2679]|uniref:Histone chaperone RTT106/FACT complex subunit SPT16-like middle domain-containing protein n=1 Tax=Cordyceps fumosorosea (strain ARSEF 2679) TaxID=1081104 RepID=A0A162J341_CORFA|nr:hypothetical protein ISF_04978 [Cordyceps fumosorosea ARSEF 2679]OAA63102.1 hypothetical protein ISF_04978 [Cordyceps fumosorosea ARSEF 2679]
MELDWERLNAIFKPRQDILDGIKRCAETPGKVALFNEIASHVHAKLSDNGEPEAKRRKVQAGGSTNGVTNGSSAAGNPADDPILLQVKEISVSVPQRKKFELCFTQNYLYARAPGTAVPIQGMTYAWTDIEFAFYLPVPEKAQVQHNYILFPRGSTIPPKSGPATIEPLVFTVPATAPKEGTVAGSEAGSAAAVSDTYKALFHWALSRRLRAAGSDVTIVASDPNKFHSMVRQPHRPNEKAVHVSGFRGSKDGYLFFLENGILWGFKKPLIFIPLKRIAAVSYTNILQITFNIVVEVFPEEGGEVDGADGNEEYEFGMVDQQDYGGIDDYVKRNGLQDRSMAEQRKGKLQLAENKAKKGANGEAEAEGDGMTELERAALGEDLDDDDEDEEDYNPGSDDGSDGSGESSEEDDDDDDDAGEDDEEGEGAGDEEEEDGEGEEAKDLSIR